MHFLPFLLMTAVAALALTGCATTEPAAPQYGIKEDDRSFGSLIRRYAVLTKGIPINKRYDELTAEQKAIIHSWYEKLVPGDEPPFPGAGLKPIYDAVRKGQAKALIEGELLLLAEVSSTGDVQSVKVFQSPDPVMTKYVSGVLIHTKFKPALCGGTPCRMEFPFTFTFKVE